MKTLQTSLVKKHLFIVIALFLTLETSGQNFVPVEFWNKGYVVTVKGDTILGEIRSKLKADVLNCEFRLDEQSEINNYSPDQLHGYSISNGKFFVSKKVDSLQLFLEYLVRGELSVFCDPSRTTGQKYFVEKNGVGELIILENSQVQTEIRGESQYRDKLEYIGALTYLMNDADMGDEIDNTRLSHHSLIRLSLKYHQKLCGDFTCVIYEKRYRDLYSMITGLNWSRAFLIQNGRDSVEGFVRNTSLYNSRIFFKPLFYADTKEYVAVDHDEIRLENGDQYIAKEFNDTLQFFKKILSSSINLYSSRSDLFIESDQKMYQLKNTIREYYKNDRKVREDDKKEYLGVLMYLLRQANMRSQIEKVALDKRSLVNLLKIYHQRIGSTQELVVY